MVPQIPRKSLGAAPVGAQPRRALLGPQLAFAAATVAAFATFLGARALLAPEAVVPVVSTLLLLLAALAGLVAWRRGRMSPDNVTYADVAGALTLIGLCVAATIDPEQLIRLVGSSGDQIPQ